MLKETVEKYLVLFPGERTELKLLLEQIAENERLNDRRNFRGHVTGSAIILSPDKKKVLLIYHKHFDRWQQPGGHWETDDEMNPLEVATREAEEETRLGKLEQLPINGDTLLPLDIDSHNVPDRPERDEPPHVHHDIRYVFVASTENLRPITDNGIANIAWFGFDAPETAVIKRPVAKLRALKLIT